MVGRELAPDIERCAAVGMRALGVDRGVLRLAAERQIADHLADRLDLELSLERQLVEALGLGEDAIDQRLRDAVIADEEKAEGLGRIADERASSLERACLTREKRADIDYRNFHVASCCENGLRRAHPILQRKTL